MRATDPDAPGLQRPADPVQQAHGVRRAHLQDRGQGGDVRDHRDPGRRRDHPAPARVGRLTVGQLRRDVQRAVQGADQVGTEPGGLRQRAVLRGHPPAQHQHLAQPVRELRRAQVGRPDGEPVQGQHPGHRRQDPRLVGDGDDEVHADRVLLLAGLERQDRFAGAQGLHGQAFLFGGRDLRCPGRRGRAAQYGGDPRDEVRHERSAPRAPRGGPGGQGVRLGQGVEDLQRAHRAHGLGDRAHRGRVVQVAPGGGVDQQQVVPYERPEDGDVVRVEADTGGDVAGDGLPGHRVVARPALADVVQERGHQQQVGAADPAGEGGGPYRRLDQVPVHGPGVHGVALGAAAHPLPVREQPGDQALGLQGLPHGHRRLPRPQQGEQLFAGLGRPGHGERFALRRESAYGVQGDGQTRLRGGRAEPQGEDGIAVGACGQGQYGLAVGLDHAFGQGRPRGHPVAAAAQQSAEPGPGGAGPQDAADLPPGHVACVRDDARGLVHLAQQRVRVEQPEPRRDLVLFLEREPVGGPAGDQVQGVPGVEEPPPGLGEALARCVGQPGRGDRSQRGGVAQAPAGLLEVGFEQEAQFPGPLGPLTAQGVQFRKPSGRLVAPVGQYGGAQAGEESGVTGDGAGVQQAEVHLEVLGGGAAGLGGGPDRVVQGEAEVPYGVPEAVGERAQRARLGLAVVQQHQVEVAARGEFGAPVPADGHQRGTADTCLPYGGREQGVQPCVGQPGQGGTARRPGPRLLLEESQPGRGVSAGSRVGRVVRVLFDARHPGAPVS